MDVDDLICGGIPVAESLEVIERDSLDFDAEGSFSLLIGLFGSLTLFEIFLVAAIDDSRSGFKLLPDFLADFLGNGADGTPAIVETLESAESSDRIRHGFESLSLIDEETLGLEIFLEVEIAKFLINLQIIVETLNDALESLPNFSFGSSGDILDSLEILLELLELRELGVDIIDITGNFLHRSDNFLLLFEVGSAAFFVSYEISCTFFFKISI